MRTDDLTLELQAYVDGELPAGRRAEVERALAQDADARTLVAGLRQLGTVLREHQPAARVPETREFYWAQIQRRLAAAERADAAAVKPARSALDWLRWVVPALGVAAVAVVLTLPKPGPGALAPATAGLAADSTVLTFHSDADGLTLHWIN
jgi:anti-sigma-K factor RskA